MNAISVQQKLNDCLSVLLRFQVETMGCGRTDKGVHAKEYYAHFDTESEIPDMDRFLISLNALLPNDIAVYSIIPVHQTAHVRFHAVARTYEYEIVRKKDPFRLDSAWYLFSHRDIDRMNEAAQLMLTHRDFSCFAKSGGRFKTPECRVSEARWIEQDDTRIFTITANRFLRNMVRAVVGTLLEVGDGSMSVADFQNLLVSGNRCDAGISVPAHGLSLVSVRYPFIIEGAYVG